MKVLLVKTSSLGDVVHNLPMVSDIQALRPDVEIHWLVERAFADIPRLHPAVRTVIPLDLRRWLRAPGRRASWAALRDLRRTLRAASYDLVLDTQGLVKSALVAHLAGAPVYGPDRRSAREPLAAAFYQKGLPMSWDQHAVWRNRALGAAAFGYPLPQSAPDYGLTPPPPRHERPAPTCMALHATSRQSKMWPHGHWVALARTLAERGLTALLPSGNADERRAAETIAEAVGAGAEALPPLTIQDLAAIMADARIVVGVDTGLAHLAAALKKPTVGIFCDSDPGQTGILSAHGAANLGGFGACPSVDEVLRALEDLGLEGGA